MNKGKRVDSNSKDNYENKAKKKQKKDKRNVMSIAFKFIAFVYVVITIIFYISVIKMDLLPNIYVTIFTIAEIAFTLAMVVGLIKTHRTYKLNIFCLIIVLLLSGIYIYVCNYTFATSSFLGSVFKEVAETEEYYVVVKQDSTYTKIEDLKQLYIFQVPEDVKNEVSNKVKLEYKTENDLKTLGENLISKKDDAIFISSAQYDILDEEIENFKSNTKIIYTASHEIKVNSKVEDENSKYKVENGVFNIYISGIDTSGKISNVARSDANIIVTVNTKTHEVLLTSIPRDYYVTLHTYKAKDKLTHSGIYGINETVTTVEDLLGIDINYYVRVNFTTVIKLVDTLGGVDVYSDYNFTTNGYSFHKGYNHVDGKKALAFSRERYSFSGR